MKQINPNLGETLIPESLLGGCFFPLNDTFIWICTHILHLVYTPSFTDLCFLTKQEKKVLYKSISKSIYGDTYYLLFAIIITECDVSSSSSKFSSLYHKKVAVLGVWIRKKCRLLKDGYPWQEPNPRCSKLFIFK